MLTGLTIQNIVLIEHLELAADAGLCALTGETGAGKSILLDALGLALGHRADAGLVRHGTKQASVTAAFDVPPDHPATALLHDKDIPFEGDILLRRSLNKDGKSKAYINDAPVSAGFLKEVGKTLVEIHGQFDTQALFDVSVHRATLDSFADLEDAAAALGADYTAWRNAETALRTAKDDIDTLKMQEDYLRHAVKELDDAAPEVGEENTLNEKRTRLKTFEKRKGALDDALRVLDADGGVRDLIGQARAMIDTLDEDAAPIRAALKRAKAEAEDASWQIEKMQSDGSGNENLSAIEERFFTLRALAKKHRCTSDELADIHAQMAQKLRLITDQDDALAELELCVRKHKKAYADKAAALSGKRAAAAEKLQAAVQKELPPLKLERARFHVACTALSEDKWGPDGMDHVQFMVTTNPGAPPAPLNKIASGGELARFMLALKAILSARGSTRAMIFDEVDTGIGGATADAVGERLSCLAQNAQVLVVTHSPQVAARAQAHWHVAKTEQKGTVITQITPLKALAAREEEIARMLSGAKITKEARAQAARLLKGEVA